MTAEESLDLLRRSIATHLQTHHPGLLTNLEWRLRRRFRGETEETVIAMFAGLGSGVTANELRAYVEHAHLEGRL